MAKAKAETKQEEQVEETVQEQPAGEPTQISLNDIEIARRVIGTASQRGAFKGEELSTVGNIYDKFSAFIKEYTAGQDTESEDDSEESQTE